MKRFVQIFENKAYWIFEAEQEPTFAPNIVLLDITGNNDVQEGWDYNPATNTFSSTSAYIAPVAEEPFDNQTIIMNALADLYIAVMKLTNPPPVE